jgi:hypothetical protein
MGEGNVFAFCRLLPEKSEGINRLFSVSSLSAGFILQRWEPSSLTELRDWPIILMIEPSLALNPRDARTTVD